MIDMSLVREWLDSVLCASFYVGWPVNIALVALGAWVKWGGQ